VTIKTYSKQNPWKDGGIRAKLKAWTIAFKQPSQTQRGSCLHTDLKSLATLINGSLVTLIMFTYLALLISYVYTVFHTIYCILPFCHCSSIYLYILIPFLYLDLCVLGRCCGIVRYCCTVRTRSKSTYTRNNIC
jgi:hypothetical protein